MGTELGSHEALLAGRNGGSQISLTVWAVTLCKLALMSTPTIDDASPISFLPFQLLLGLLVRV